MSRIDLHTHTTFSDGSFSPTELIDLANQQGLDILAITDHDTTDGLPEALEATKNLSLELIPGIELSAQFQNREMHILGYFINPNDPQFQARLDAHRSTRIERICHILDRLQSLGMDISLAEVERASGTGTIGRPHIAQVLIDKGHIKTMKEAFEQLLGSRGKAYVERIVSEAQEIIEWITDAGGIPILAHPYWEGFNKEDSATACQTLVEQGLQGLEVFYGTFSARHISFNLGLAKRFDLLMTGGSDFHGTMKPDITLGKGKGSLHVPSKVMEQLRIAAGQ
ncbi:MAG: PHP domain-containing protein [Nitrospirales bacterium]|nr:MAG: PHP domain-containing protein [Nitrospirales bacterium]